MSDVCQELPAFELRTGDGRVMAVYASGRTDGIPADYTIVINRIPTLLQQASAGGQQELLDLKRTIERSGWGRHGQ